MKKIMFIASAAILSTGPVPASAQTDPGHSFCVNFANVQCDALLQQGVITQAERGQCWRDYYNDCRGWDIE